MARSWWFWPTAPSIAGVYWTGTEAVTVPDLGSDHEQAVEDFREVLQERRAT